MTYYYPAVIRKKEEGYRVDVIDLEDCYGEGKTKEEALEDARYAGVNWLLVESEESMDFRDRPIWMTLFWEKEKKKPCWLSLCLRKAGTSRSLFNLLKIRSC